MTLRPGTVHSYHVSARENSSVTPPPISFDQRQHCARGPRAGSWMAVAFTLPRPATLSHISEAYHELIKRHSTMRTIVCDPSDPHLSIVDIEPGTWQLLDPTDNSRDALRELFDDNCQPFAVPSHHLCVVDHLNQKHTSFDSVITDATIVIGYDHSHTDAWSLLVTVRDFTLFLDASINGVDPSFLMKPTLGFGDHSQQLTERAPAPEHIVSAWHKHLGSGEMPTFPGDLGDLSEPRDQVVEVIDLLNHAELKAFESAAKAQNTSMLSLAVATMAPVKAVFPIHSRHQPQTPPETWQDAMGWFITNSILDCESSDPADAKEAIKETIQLGSYPLAPIMEPYGGELPIGPGMFAISWLDNRKLPVAIEQGLYPQHISAEIQTDGVMMWFVINDDGMHLRYRYPDTAQARISVPSWCHAVCSKIHAIALSNNRPATMTFAPETAMAPKS